MGEYLFRELPTWQQSVFFWFGYCVYIIPPVFQWRKQELELLFGADCYDGLKCKISLQCETCSLYMTYPLLDAFLLDICGTSSVCLYYFLGFVHARKNGLLLKLAVKQS